tara:strand:+ start:229 stop:543 length:315 start_codon:yes stop_codon:yes gene_type:complete
MAESDQAPPRLPDPPRSDSPFGYNPGRRDSNLWSLQFPSKIGATGSDTESIEKTADMVYELIDKLETRNTQYMQDLVRALEFYIAQQQRDEIANNSRSISWFIG